MTSAGKNRLASKGYRRRRLKDVDDRVDVDVVGDEDGAFSIDGVKEREWKDDSDGRDGRMLRLKGSNDASHAMPAMLSSSQSHPTLHRPSLTTPSASIGSLEFRPHLVSQARVKRFAEFHQALDVLKTPALSTPSDIVAASKVASECVRSLDSRLQSVGYGINRFGQYRTKQNVLDDWDIMKLKMN